MTTKAGAAKSDDADASSVDRDESAIRGLGLKAGDEHYRAFVGPPEYYDRIALLYVEALGRVGMRETSSVLDVGCGSLRGGKMLIPFLLPGRYCGIEPKAGLVDEGIEHELGRDIVRIKRPRFGSSDRFDASEFGQRFDLIIAQSVFSHAAAWQIRLCLGEMKRVMHDGSLFVFTYWPGEADHAGDEWVYPGTAGYTRGFFDAVTAEAGLAVKDLSLGHPAGQRWLVAGSDGAVAGV